MQLFGLVNGMLQADRDAAERDLSIARYAVIPLSPNSGLIGCGGQPLQRLWHVMLCWWRLRPLVVVGLLRSLSNTIFGQKPFGANTCNSLCSWYKIHPVGTRTFVNNYCSAPPHCRWVPNTDTLHALIREFRDARKIPLNMEHRMMLGMAPDYDHLMVIQKVEVFEHALEGTAGDDLHKVRAAVGDACTGLCVCVGKMATVR